MTKTKVTKRRTVSGPDDGEKNKEKAKKRKVENEPNILVDNTLFGELIAEAGIVLKAGNHPNELKQDQAIFQKNFLHSLKKHFSYPEVIDEFVEGLANHIEDKVRFRWSLMPCLIPSDSEADSHRGTADSMFKLLLGIDVLQPKLMEKLLEKLAEICVDEEEFIFDDFEKVNFPSLIITQFRWLDRVVNSKELMEKMFEILPITSVAIQREIISCMPEVIEDCQHSYVAKQLRDLLLESNDLTVPVLDALSNLSLTPELLSEVRESILQTLQSVKLEDMPVIIKFLLQTVMPSDALEVVKQLREQLDFSSCLPVKLKNKKQAKGRVMPSKSTERSLEALTLDAINLAIRFHRFVAEAWIKTIDGVVSDYKPLDVIVLILLHSNNYKKPVESLVRNKIRLGRFSEELVQGTFSGHGDVLQDYFSTVLTLGEILLRSIEPNIRHFASCIYKYGFQAFDTYCQQEIIGNLLTHIGSGIDYEIDQCLDILMDLSHSCFNKMALFVMFIKGILDYMDNLSVRQIRKLYSILSLLIFKNSRQDDMVQDELHMLIRKQLFHSDIKYIKMGVIGAVMIIQSMAANLDDGSDKTAEENVLPEERCEQAVNLLELVKTSCSKSPEANALFLDELAMIVYSGKLEGRVEDWIAKNITSDFLENFVVDIDVDKKEGTDILPWKLSYGIDDEVENPIVINLVPMLAKGYMEKHNKLKNNPRNCLPLCLSPNFRLLQICESRQNDGDISGIDALLGCPLYVVDPQAMDKISSLSTKEKELLADSVFFTVNWFIEVLNAFGSEENAEMKGKVMVRLQDITDLRNTLQKTIIPGIPNYIPPPANFDLGEIQPPKQPLQAKKTKKPGAGKKNKHTDVENVMDESDQIRDSTVGKLSQVLEKDSSVMESPATSVTTSVDIDSYAPFFREMDLSVFKVLSVGLITKTALDTELNTTDTVILQLQPHHLEFLLKDLVRKTEHALMATKKTTFLKKKPERTIGFSHLDCLTPVQVCTQLVQLLPSLCDQMESASAFFQTLQAASDGILDGPGFNTEEAHVLTSCFHLILKILVGIFSWAGFQMREHHFLLKEAISVFHGRLNSDTASQVPIKSLFRQGFQYLEHFSASLPSLPAATTLCKLLLAIADLADSTEMKAKIGMLSAELLRKEWVYAYGEKAKGAKHNEELNLLLKIYLENSSDEIGCLEDLATVAVPELIQADKDGCSAKYPTLTRDSFPVFYKAMLTGLVSVVKEIQVCKAKDPDDIKMEKLCQWHIAVRVFHVNVNLIKTFDAKSNLNALLKYGCQFLGIFLHQGMPMLDEIFPHHKDDVISLIKNLQLSTRALQHLCSHSKLLHAVSLTNQVPPLKKMLEVFVYRVKAMLTMNKCLDAFWLGNLKNRNLKGEEILSQTTSVGENAGDSDPDDVAAEEDVESEIELEKESEPEQEPEEKDSDEESYSAIF